MATIVKKYIQDLGVLGLIAILCGVIGSAVTDLTGLETRFIQGFFTAAIFYDWYRKA